LSHTVDEVSELLDVPRPTLYRYLKEYSIPHVRRSGKIYVPEESFDWIKEARELHKEGLGTDSVRRRLQGERSDLDGELAQRLDRISGTLETLQGNLKPADGESFAQTLQAISVKQNVLISAVFDLTEMLEGLLVANGRSRKAAPLEAPEEEMWKQKPSFEEREEHYEKAEEDTAANGPAIEAIPESVILSTARGRRRKFGNLTRRRQRAALVVLLTLLTSTALTVAVAQGNKESPEEMPQKEVSAPSQEATTSIPREEANAENYEAVPLYSPAHDDERLARYDEGGNEEKALEALPEPFPQEYPWLPPTPDDGALP
jgi:excisionase family DNA binding protein